MGGRGDDPSPWWPCGWMRYEDCGTVGRGGRLQHPPAGRATCNASTLITPLALRCSQRTALHGIMLGVIVVLAVRGPWQWHALVSGCMRAGQGMKSLSFNWLMLRFSTVADAGHSQ